MASTGQLQAWFAAAEQTEFALVTGGRAVSVSSSSGRSVTYAQADLSKLQAYVASLRGQLGLSNVKPMRPIIGGSSAHALSLREVR